MTTTQAERIERAVYDLRQHQPGPRPDHTPAPAAAPPRDPTNPIAHLTDDQLDDLTQNLLEDWDNPIFTPLGLCRAHRLSLSQIQAIAARPVFTDALARIRAINAARRADIEARARQIALERLCALCDQHPTGATHTKELRLTIKQLLALITPTPTDPSSTSPNPTTPTPTSPDRKGGMPPTTESSTRAPPPSSNPIRPLNNPPSPPRNAKPQLAPTGREGMASTPIDSTHAPTNRIQPMLHPTGREGMASTSNNTTRAQPKPTNLSLHPTATDQAPRAPVAPPPPKEKPPRNPRSGNKR